METDWKKKYNEALERARALREEAIEKEYVNDYVKDYEAIFPELAESEDEKIRKEIVSFIRAFWVDHRDSVPQTSKWLDWLEKQKDSLHISETCKENADSFTDEDERIRKYIVNFVELEKGVNLPPDDADRMLAYLEKQKEQKVDLDKLRKDIYQSGYNDGYQHGKEDAQKEQKPAEWSDTDNIGWDESFACVTRAEKAAKNEEELQNAVTAENWLKEIKFKYCVHPVKPEWSEEDSRILYNVIAYVGYAAGQRGVRDDEFKEANAWLKSLKNRGNSPKSNANSPWKPSEEQMEALRDAVKLYKATHFENFHQRIESLYEQLRRLYDSKN